MEDIKNEAGEAETPEVAKAEAPAKRRRGPNRPKTEVAKAEADEAPAVRRLPVKLIRNYHPADQGFTISGRKPTSEESEKVFAGTEIEIEVSEAQAACRNGIAVRNDPFA